MAEIQSYKLRENWQLVRNLYIYLFIFLAWNFPHMLMRHILIKVECFFFLKNKNVEGKFLVAITSCIAKPIHRIQYIVHSWWFDNGMDHGFGWQTQSIEFSSLMIVGDSFTP